MAKPGWTVVIFPPLGSGGANVIGGRYTFPGTYHNATLRALYMNPADALE